MAATSSLTLQKGPRRILFSVNSRSQRSMGFGEMPQTLQHGEGSRSLRKRAATSCDIASPHGFAGPREQPRSGFKGLTA
jgi:hypothetical protein